MIAGLGFGGSSLGFGVSGGGCARNHQPHKVYQRSENHRFGLDARVGGSQTKSMIFRPLIDLVRH